MCYLLGFLILLFSVVSYSADQELCQKIISGLGSQKLGIAFKKPQDFLLGQKYSNNSQFALVDDGFGMSKDAEIVYFENGRTKTLTVDARDNIANLSFVDKSLHSSKFLKNLTQQFSRIEPDGTKTVMTFPRDSYPSEMRDAKIKSPFEPGTEIVQRMWIQLKWKEGKCIPMEAHKPVLPPTKMVYYMRSVSLSSIPCDAESFMKFSL